MSKQSSKPSSTFRENRAHSFILSYSLSLTLFLSLSLSFSLSRKNRRRDWTTNGKSARFSTLREEMIFRNASDYHNESTRDMLGRYQSSSGVKRLCVCVCVCVFFFLYTCLVCVLYGMWTPPRETGESCRVSGSGRQQAGTKWPSRRRNNVSSSLCKIFVCVSVIILCISVCVATSIPGVRTNCDRHRPD